MTALTPNVSIAPRIGAALLTLALAFLMVAGYRAALVDTQQAVQATLTRSAHLV
jgi:hypothetical protein